MKRINEIDVLNFIEAVYSDGFTPRQRKIFERTRESFSRLRNKILPMFKNRIAQDDLNKLIGSVEVVPSCYEDDYLKMLEEGEHFELVKFYLPLAYPQFYKLFKNGQIYTHSDTIFCRARYDEELGLIVDEFETNILE